MLIIALIIERLVVCSRPYYRLDPTKINKVTIDSIEYYIVNADEFEIKRVTEGVLVKSGDKQVVLDGMLYDIPTHVSEKLRLFKFDKHTPINSICSIWNCYTGVSMGNIFGSYKMISKQYIQASICNNELHV